VRALAKDIGKPTEAEIARALELLQEQRPHQYQVLVLSADHTQVAIAEKLGIKDRSCVSRRLATARESFAGYLRAVLAQRG
jgi:hypothetical protein